MDRVIIPKLERQDIGVWDKAGWYLGKHEQNPSRDILVFQCRFGHSGRVPASATINRDGTIDPVMQCHCLKFEESVTLAGWPDWFYKLEGREEITKNYGLTK